MCFTNPFQSSCVQYRIEVTYFVTDDVYVYDDVNKTRHNMPHKKHYLQGHTKADIQTAFHQIRELKSEQRTRYTLPSQFPREYRLP